MSSHQLKALLQSARDAAHPTMAGPLERWRADLEALVAQLGGWTLGIDAGAWAQTSDVLLHEQETGRYNAKSMSLRWEGVPGEVHVQPYGLSVHRARLMDGSYSGRIDGVVRITYGAERRPVCRSLVGSTTVWSLSTQENPALHPLDSESFAAVIIELVGPALRTAG
jgi:hypothetical protein